MPSDLPEFQTTPISGPDPAPVNHSANPVADLRLRMFETYGLRGSGSSESADLQSSLESRLRAILAGGGSTVFALTWKPLTTPAQRRVCQLLARVQSTSDIESSSWPTPCARDWRDLSHRGTEYAAARARRQPSAVTTSYIRGFGYTQIRYLLSRLMGFPDQWVSCAPSETPSTRG